jgi:hypothetical protein
MIRGWEGGKLTWGMLCNAVAPLTNSATTRQTLSSHLEIKTAYDAKKKGLKIHGARAPLPSSRAVAGQRIEHLLSTVDELKAVNARLLEDRLRWQYNAYKHGMTEQELEEELPRIDRERTDGKTSTELRNDRENRGTRGRRGKCQSI